MSNYNKKGFRAVKVRNSSDGMTFSAAVRVGGRIDRSIRHRDSKVLKAIREQNRTVKAAQREAKKAVPIELRARVNWSAVGRGIQA